ncbi:uncharacterized protein A1O5_02870 [Cladophialophora psammophila CBS 110553]|uniref:Uncharacterized protein n=1 Tax=Cladophialophora psammophila CBS 110553 TaxID=1182543 RepID=W9XWD7_9EURO|nr:uncharacterized protein A1O5_02870 [Cladophialophora psammophila CBS 110553]EXJ74574.1 hypothetical protein A1O5_02870 [Cladophialophora psammophila CBS 110553]
MSLMALLHRQHRLSNERVGAEYLHGAYEHHHLSTNTNRMLVDVVEVVRNFIGTIPRELTRPQMDDFCRVFYHSLHASHDLRFRLMLLFRGSLPRPSVGESEMFLCHLVRELAGEDISNPTDMNRIQNEIEDFYAKLPFNLDQQLMNQLKFKWNIDDLRPDFPMIMGRFQGYMMNMIVDFYNLPVENACRQLQQSLKDLRATVFLDDGASGMVPLEDVPIFCEQLARNEEVFDQARARNFHAEQILVALEASWGQASLSGAARHDLNEPSIE